MRVYIHTNHDRVDRIYVAFPSTSSEDDIKTKYNNLISQFNKNNKYMSFIENKPIPSDENIAYGNKKYQASYKYINPEIDKDYFLRRMADAAIASVPKDKAEQFTALMNMYLDSSDKDRELMTEKLVEISSEFVKSNEDPQIALESLKIFMTYLDNIDSFLTGTVWFTIHKNHWGFNIGLYYDNLSNRAKGEDL